MNALPPKILVEPTPVYVPEQSDPERGLYFFAYTIRITNRGDQTVQLLSRHWWITDGSGRIQEVEGPGVVGEQPVLEPGEHFEYTSFCPLPTAVGSMRGTYQMTTTAGDRFEAEIPEFTLAAPQAVN